jgi:8-oxo-dGTP diphosphatase
MSERTIRFCPYCGASTMTRFLYGADRPACLSCGWIYFEDPKVAVAVVIKQDGKVLLTMRDNEPFLGFWTLPAGFVDAHEHPERAAERECLEETGLVVHVSALLNLVYGREHPHGADILLVYAAEITGGELHPGDDAGDAAFFDPDNLPPLAFRSTRTALGLE